MGVCGDEIVVKLEVGSIIRSSKRRVHKGVLKRLDSMEMSIDMCQHSAGYCRMIQIGTT